MKTPLALLALLGSVGTLVCCVLPAVFVALGMGAAFASLLTAAPGLVWLSAHKGWVFAAAGVAIAAAVIAHWRGRAAECPADPRLAQACGKLKGWSFRLLVASIACFAVGAFFAYVAPRLL